MKMYCKHTRIFAPAGTLSKSNNLVPYAPIEQENARIRKSTATEFRKAWHLVKIGEIMASLLEIFEGS